MEGGIKNITPKARGRASAGWPGGSNGLGKKGPGKVVDVHNQQGKERGSCMTQPRNSVETEF